MALSNGLNAENDAFPLETWTEDPEFRDGLALLVKLRAAVDRCLVEHLASLEEQFSFGLLHTMYKRALSQIEGCFLLFSNGHHSCAEALCRTALEASLNLYVCSLGDSEAHFISYFKTYISTEREQNRKWLFSVDASEMSAEAKQVHRDRIAEKERALLSAEAVLKDVFGQIGRNYENNNQPWPSTFDRFEAIGKELDYRTLYVALCSQAHSDAEDLINDFVTTVTHVAGLNERQQRENISFALMMILMVLKIVVEGAGMYIAKFEIDPRKTIIPLLIEAGELIRRVAERPVLNALPTIRPLGAVS